MSDTKAPVTGEATTKAPGQVSGRATAEALTALSEAWRSIEAARGHLYEFHHHAGAGDAYLVRAVTLLRTAGHHDLADAICHHLLGRGVSEDRWNFQVDEGHDDDFARTLMTVEEQVRSRVPIGSGQASSRASSRASGRAQSRSGRTSRP